MKLRTSFFDKTVLKKDLTRFFPLWALYLIGGLLVMHVLSGFYDVYYDGRSYSMARDLNGIIAPLCVFSAGYGFLVAQLLFGDLHNTRLCYGIHAFPLRREGWYLTHITSGLLMGLVPSLVVAITLMPVMGQFWFTPLLCWGGIALHYLFFFALSVFCMICTGNRVAATAVYGIVNFLSLIIRWFVQSVYLPLLPGVRINTDIFQRFCPVVELVERDDFINIIHLENCALCRQTQIIGSKDIYVSIDGGVHDYAFQGLGGDWGYLLILAAVGLALLGAGLALYRIRHLERAGDFMAFKPMKPIFLTVYTLCVGCLMFYFAYELADTATGFVFLVIGIFIGFFTGKMLLERTIRVFRGKSFAAMGILYAAVALSLLLTWIDPVGISRRIPQTEKVEVVYLYDGNLSDYQLSNPDRLPSRSDVITITDAADIEAIRQAHKLMLQEHDQNGYNNTRRITLQYRLKNGSTVSRTYRIPVLGQAIQALAPYLSDPYYLFGVDSPEQLLEQLNYIYFSEMGEILPTLYPELVKALWFDTQEGYISISGSGTSGYRMMYMELSMKKQYRTLYFTENAPHIQQWLKTNAANPQLILQSNSLKELQATAEYILCSEYSLDLLPADCPDFLELLWEDCKNGFVTSDGKWNSGLWVDVVTSRGYLSLTLSPESKAATYLANFSLASNQ